ncbi:hypothetical protein HDU97_001146 [Phlyctochytrium planicorne]|nr:hypothetical protein HDU97_001146 [Phlyctochytrium planicorne]
MDTTTTTTTPTLSTSNSQQQTSSSSPKKSLRIDTHASSSSPIVVPSHGNGIATHINIQQSQLHAAGGLASPYEPPHSAPLPHAPIHPPHHPHFASQLSHEFRSRYTLGACLGSGGFGFVCAATRIEDGVEVAVKFILREKVPRTAWVRDEILGVVPMEVFILRRIRHANIIQYLDYFHESAYCLLVTELHGGNWSSNANSNNNVPTVSQTSINSSSAATAPSAFTAPPFLQRRNSCDLFECIELMERFNEDQAKHVFRQIASAVAYLSVNGVVHRDIKDENILIDDSFNVKLIDFGSASFMNHSDNLFLGTLQYAAPEIFEGHRQRGSECEVWSLGCCLYIMLTGEVPFPTPHDVRFSQPQPFRPNVGSLSRPCTDLMHWMLEKDPRKRAGVNDILSHAWLR